MSGGQRIDDRKNWIGGMGESVLPMGAKAKRESSSEGAGELNEYWDTTEKIKAKQEMGKAKIKANPLKQGYNQ